MCNFADDNAVFVCETTLPIAKTKLVSDLTRTIDWFTRNSLIENPDKFQIMFLGVNDPVTIQINGKEFRSQNFVKLLGVYTDTKLKFTKHIECICKTANNKVSQLLRIRHYISIEQARPIVNAYILPYFFYCPLIWMFCHKKEVTQINRVHKRALRAIQNDHSATFEKLLELAHTVSIVCMYEFLCYQYKITIVS